MSTDADGLASVQQVEALADQLSALADEIHQRVLRDIKERNGKLSEDEQQLARKLFDDELLLRQRANGLYADAATLVVKSLGKSQAHVMALTVAAGEKIRKIGMIASMTGLVASILGLAGAVATGQVAPIVLAIEKLRKQTKLVDAYAPKKPK